LAGLEFYSSSSVSSCISSLGSSLAEIRFLGVRLISFNIIQKRDIYQDFENDKNLFFFNYDEEDKLCEIEIHDGIELFIENKNIKIGEDINSVIEKLEYPYSENEDGNYSFNELKINIANSEYMGGIGNNLSYIYLTKYELESE
jgi:hypothetical protein